MKIKAAEPAPAPLPAKETTIAMIASRDYGIRLLIEKTMRAVWGPDIDDQLYMLGRVLKPHWERWDTVMAKIIEKHSHPVNGMPGRVAFTPVGQMQLNALFNSTGKEKVTLPPAIQIPVEQFRATPTGVGSLDRMMLEDAGIITIIMPVTPAPAPAEADAPEPKE